MNKLKAKVITSALTASLLVMSVGSAQAAEASTEQAVSQFVVMQGKQLMVNVSNQLQQSIAQSVNSFSIEQAVSWLSADDAEEADAQLAQKETKTKLNKSEEE